MVILLLFICILCMYNVQRKVLNILERLISHGPLCAEYEMVEICACISTWHRHRRTRRSIVPVDTQAVNQASDFLGQFFFTHVVQLLSLGQERGQVGQPTLIFHWGSSDLPLSWQNQRTKGPAKSVPQAASNCCQW